MVEDFPAHTLFLVASYRHHCDFCMTAHSWGARRQGIDEEVVRALREGRPLIEPKLEALRVFVAAMLEKRGAVSDEEKQAFFAAGYHPRQALEIILGLAPKTLTNYTNALVRHPIRNLAMPSGNLDPERAGTIEI